MSKKYLLLVVMGMNVLLPCAYAAQKQQELPIPPNKETQMNDNVKELLLLMDADKNGKISRDEWMKFMAMEFDRLDKDKSGALDQKELQQSRIAVPCKRFSAMGK
jgi:Ca2+-binding EF-hand superfamily protein